MRGISMRLVVVMMSIPLKSRKQEEGRIDHDYVRKFFDAGLGNRRELAMRYYVGRAWEHRRTNNSARKYSSL